MAESGDRERLEFLFEQAEGLPPDERAQWLDQLSASEPALAAELRSLLEFDSSAVQRLRGIMDRAVADAARGPLWPGQFGAYRVLRTIASGGMGTVFEAVREQDYHKRVALKVAASAIGTPAWIERFQQERQILAGLDHPHIARFLDGGASADGLPYFAMELVEGEPITDFVRNRNAGLRERVELFRKVCAAVSFAHQSLVVHRDLKPPNILVTADGEPKLLDFGLAKLQSPIEPNLALTQTALTLLTPSYCSPEQVQGGKITTRVDVYLLGLVLFEVLTGSQAHQLTGSSPAELHRVISESPPPVPSARAIENGDPSLARSLRGDLDTIVVKALQKDPAVRYQSVDELNDDLGRYLDGLPILARRAAWGYRAAKFLRRNWIPVGAAGAVILALIAGALAFAWQARIAERRFGLARRLANVLLFDIHDKVQAMPGAIDLQETISAKAVEYLDALSNETGRNYALRRELAAAYVRLNAAQWRKNGTAPRQGSDSILAMLNRAIALLEDMPSAELALAASTEAQLLNRRGRMLGQSGRLEAARADFERAEAVSPCRAADPVLCESRILALQNLIRLHEPAKDWPRCQALVADLWRTLDAYRASNDEIYYEWNALNAVYLESKMLHLQHRSAEAAEVLERGLRLAGTLESHLPLPPEALFELATFYGHFGRQLRGDGQRTPHERIAVVRKGLEFAQSLLRQDSDYIVAHFLLADLQNELAVEYELVDRQQAGRYFRLAVDTYLERPEAATSALDWRVNLYANGQDAQRFFLQVHRPEEALEVARRISAVMSPAIFLKLDLPRTKEAQRIQALWWTASEATHEKADCAEGLWTRTVREAQQSLLRTPQDPVIQTSAAFAFDGWADWLNAHGRPADGEGYRQQSQALWSHLSTQFPDNSYLRNRVQGVRDRRHD